MEESSKGYKAYWELLYRAIDELEDKSLIDPDYLRFSREPQPPQLVVKSSPQDEE
jgi:hypothetical protein